MSLRTGVPKEQGVLKLVFHPLEDLPVCFPKRQHGEVLFTYQFLQGVICANGVPCTYNSWYITCQIASDRFVNRLTNKIGRSRCRSLITEQRFGLNYIN